MEAANVVDLAREALWVTLLVSAPTLLMVLAVGVIIGILQAATSVNESSVAFIPKLLVLGAVILLVGPSSLGVFVDYLKTVILDIPDTLK